jgi:hypothetical protein
MDKVRIRDKHPGSATPVFLDSDPGSHDDVPLSFSAAVLEAAGGIHHRQRLVYSVYRGIFYKYPFLVSSSCFRFDRFEEGKSRTVSVEFIQLPDVP